MTRESFIDIFDAAERGSIEDVRYFVEEQGTDVNAIDYHWGRSVLHFAAQKNAVEVFQYLVSRGADVHATDCSLYTPFHEAAWWNYGNIAVIQYLVSVGADVNAQCAYGATPIHKAVERNSLEVIQYLISQGAKFDTNDLLYFAVKFNPLDVLLYIVSLGADVHAECGEGDTLLHIAALSNSNVEVLKYLISQGIDVHAKNDDGDTPLDLASSEEKKQILRETMGITGTALEP
ncbi:MAG: ankyrin repeat domain-containing protein [Planctomycetaceae bacterium]|jgi:ankyrin repeat protein|nr:ankyrin repeat domain-containing protein [Planctomycetaceae bacterium]